MKITASAISYLLAIIGVARSNFYQEAYVDQAIRRILQSVGQQDVIIRIQRYDIYDGAQRLLDVVARNVATTWPSQILVSSRIKGFGFSPGDLASSRTLLVYIYASNNDVNDAELDAVLNDVNFISYPKHVPKLLLIIGSNKGTLDGQRQLRYLWDQKHFDVIILEISFHSQYSEPVFVAIHKFNGFNESYSRVTVYDGDTDWYPNKSGDMYGGTFKVTFEEVPPYGTFENDTVGGLAELFKNVLSNALNGTVVHTDALHENDMRYNAEGLVYEDWYSTQNEHTVAIGDDRVCALIPAMPEERILIDFWRIIMTILFGFLLAAVVWCVSLMMSISERVRDPLNTISLFLGMTPPYGPRSLVEKVLYVAVVFTVAEYTIMFQAELIEFVVEFADKTHVTTFQDLYNTGLKVVVSPVVHDELEAAEGLSPEFMKRFVNSKYDLQSKDGKVDTSKAYFTSEIGGKLAEARLKRDGKHLFKLSGLCILSHYRVHRIHMKSPFKNKVNAVLLSLTESGFVEKHLNDFWKDNKSGNERDNRMSLSDHSVYVAFFVIVVGNMISLIVFLAEITASRVFKCEHFSPPFSYCKSMKKSKQSKTSAAKNTMTPKFINY